MEKDYLITVNVDSHRWRNLQHNNNLQSDSEAVEFLLKLYEGTQAGGQKTVSCERCGKLKSFMCVECSTSSQKNVQEGLKNTRQKNTSFIPNQISNHMTEKQNYAENQHHIFQKGQPLMKACVIKLEPCDIDDNGSHSDTDRFNDDDNDGSFCGNEDDSNDANIGLRLAEVKTLRKGGSIFSGTKRKQENTAFSSSKQSRNSARTLSQQQERSRLSSNRWRGHFQHSCQSHDSLVMSSQSAPDNLFASNQSEDSLHSVSQLADSILPPSRSADSNICSECSAVFTTQKALKNHGWEQHGLGDPALFYQCDNCGKRVATACIYRSHMLKKHGRKIDAEEIARPKHFHTFTCQHCEETFLRLESLAKHVKKEHGGDEDLEEEVKKIKLECPDCGRKACDKKQLDRHRWEVHGFGNPQLFFTCEMCGDRVAYAHQFRIHMQRKHQKSVPSDVLLRPSLVKAELKKQALVCPDCARPFKRLERLRDHRIVKHNYSYENELKFACTVCSRRFARNVSLIFHMKMHELQNSGLHYGTDAPTSAQSIGTCALASGSCSEDASARALDNSASLDDSSVSAPASSYGSDVNLTSQRESTVDGDFTPRLTGSPHSNFPQCQSSSHGDMLHPRLNGKAYRCEDCGLSFHLLRLLTQHKGEAHGGKILKCPHCNLVTTDDGYRRKHLWEYHGIGEAALHFACDLCSKRMYHTRKYRQHMQAAHNVDASEEVIERVEKAKEEQLKQKLTCFHCSKVFSRQCHVRHHLRTVHRFTADDLSGKDVFTCEMCGKRFRRAIDLDNHKKQHDLAQSKRWDTMGAEELNRTLIKDFVEKGIHATEEYRSFMNVYMAQYRGQCPVCHKGVDTIRRHLLYHMPVAPLQCSQCAERFYSTKNRLKHVLEVHNPEKQIVCGDCGKAFMHPCALKSHRLRHHLKIRNVICQHCGKLFCEKNDLRTHCRLHHPSLEGITVEEFPCPECGKVFTVRARLTTHLLRHTGIRTMACDQCPKKFFNMQGLNQHLVIHSEEKKFLCPHCNKGFKQKWNMEAHVRIHTGERPFVCEDCGKPFISATRRLDHRRKVHGLKTRRQAKPFQKCEIIEDEDGGDSLENSSS